MTIAGFPLNSNAGFQSHGLPRFEVGGSSPSRGRGAGLARPAPSPLDFEEALGDEAPMELWTRPLRGAGDGRYGAAVTGRRMGFYWRNHGKTHRKV